MYEPAHEDLTEYLFSPDLVVWVRLQYRAKAGNPTHRFKYEKKRLKDLGAKYIPRFHVWELPQVEES